jgi:hypothetical protein
VTAPTLLTSYEPVKLRRPRSVTRAAVVRKRLGGMSPATFWRLERAEPLLQAALVWVGSIKCFDDEKLEAFMEDYFNRPRADPRAYMRGDAKLKSPGRPAKADGSKKAQPKTTRQREARSGP